MNETKFSLRFKCLIYFAVAFVASLVGIVLRTVNLFFFFDSKPGYYVSGAVLPILEWVCYGVFALLLLSGAMLWFRKQPIGYEQKTPLLARIGAIAGVFGFGILLYADAVLFAYGTTQNVSGLVSLLLSAASVAYFLLTALNAKHEALRLLTGFCVILRLITALSNSYFNFFVPMNAPDKLMFQLGVLGAMLFLINELRAIVASPRSATYMFFAGIATLLLGASSLPSLLALREGILSHTGLTPATVALLGMYLAVALRFLSLCLSPTPKQEEIMDAAEAPAEEAIATDTVVGDSADGNADAADVENDKENQEETEQ